MPHLPVVNVRVPMPPVRPPRPRRVIPSSPLSRRYLSVVEEIHRRIDPIIRREGHIHSSQLTAIISEEVPASTTWEVGRRCNSQGVWFRCVDIVFPGEDPLHFKFPGRETRLYLPPPERRSSGISSGDLWSSPSGSSPRRNRGIEDEFFARSGNLPFLHRLLRSLRLRS